VAALRWTIATQGRLLLGLCLLLLGGGCSKSVEVVPLTAAEKALTTVAMAYMDAHQGLGRGPKDADELKPYLKTFGDPEQLLISPNDGEAFVIVWGADPGRGGPDEIGMFPILAYERKGRGGRCAVTDIRGRPLTVAASDLAKLTFVRGHKPALD
jgi:hypothetical protein